jgi:hypothetical protein
LALVCARWLLQAALMGKPRLDPLSKVDFRCEDCGEKFTAAPEITEECPEQQYHPWYYTAHCPACKGIAEQSPVQRGLLKAWANATGPRTAEGKAKSAANLDGHPTPEETLITRMNAMIHGGHANKLMLFPAKPGKYPTCQVCDHYGEACIENPPSYHENPPRCLKKSEILMRHHIAFEAGDPSLLIDMRANSQAGIQMLIDEMILQIAQDGGPRIMELKWYHDKEGGFHLAQYRDADTNEMVQVYEAKAHVLLKPLIEFMSKNSLTLSDMGMTPKVQQENELLEGHLKSDLQNKQDEESFRTHQLTQMEQMKAYILRSQQRLENDPVLIEHQMEDIDG